MGLTPEQVKSRRLGIGASDAKVFMEGDPAALLALWEQKTGRREVEDLSRVLPVQLGTFTEAFNLKWFTLTTGRAVTNAGEFRKHGTRDFMRCILDGMTVTGTGAPAVFEAKHVNAYSKIEEVIQRYMPQIHHAMYVCGVHNALLSVIVGTLVYEWVEIACDDFYLAQLIDRETAFWDCVVRDVPPVELPPVVAPTLPDKFRTVDFTGNNAWSANAADWIANQSPAKVFEKAGKEIKALIEPDVGTASGHGISVTRSKSGALTIKKDKG